MLRNIIAKVPWQGIAEFIAGGALVFVVGERVQRVLPVLSAVIDRSTANMTVNVTIPTGPILDRIVSRGGEILRQGERALAVVAALGALATCVVGGLIVWNKRVYLVSLILDVTANRHPMNIGLREAFRSAPVLQTNGSDLNRHGHSAAHRTAADWFITNLAGHQTRTVWSLSKSQCDEERLVRGNRYYYYGRDMIMRPSDDPLVDTDIVKMVDVDYFIEESDMAAYLRRGHPIMMYTIIPESVDVSDVDYTGRFLAGGELEMVIAGGVKYTHKLWDWNRDLVSIVDGSSSTLCRVEMKRVAKHKCVVLLLPEVTHTWVASWIARAWYSNRVYRLDVGWPPMLSIAGDVPMVSIGSPEGYLSATIPRTVFDEAMMIRQVNGKEVVPGTMERLLVSRKIHDVPPSLLTLAVNNGKSAPLRPDTNAVQGRHYQCVFDGDVNEAVREKGRFYVKPIIDGAYSAVSSRSNDLACVSGRIEKVRNEFPPAQTNPALHNTYLQYMDEFCELLVPVPHVGVPVDMEEVNEKQSRRSQRVSHELEEGIALPALNAPFESFQKAESYPKCAWPRNITNVDARHRINYSRYMYAFNVMLKTHPWYAFGLSPVDLADRMHEMAKRADELLEGDYSKWDGTLPYILKLLERKMGRRFFTPTHFNEFAKLHDSLIAKAGRTSHGIRYWCGSSRLSGGADTSAFNTAGDAFITYCAKRRQGLTPLEAFTTLGLFGGDDNVSDAVKVDLEAVVADFGMTIKIKVRVPGTPVGFLGRYWINPWEHNGSCFDLYRALSKFHYTHNADPTIPTKVILWRKAVCLWVTDSQTPLLGELAAALLRVIPEGDIGEIEHQHWVKDALKYVSDGKKVSSQRILDAHREPIFPFVDDPNIAQWAMDNLGTTASWINRVSENWEQVTEYEQIFHRTWFDAQSLEVDTPAQVDGMVVYPPGQTVIPPRPTLAPVQAKRPICPMYVKTGACSIDCALAHLDCRDFQVGKCTRPNCKFRHIGLKISSGEASTPKRK